jgi:undecaprenyl-diphosphatase
VAGNPKPRPRPLRVAALVALPLFAWLAAQASAGHLAGFDLPVRAAVHSHAAPWLTSLMRDVTHIGDSPVLLPLGGLILAYLLNAGRRRAAVRFAVTVLGGEALNELLKLIFHRPRPESIFDVPIPGSYSFPSGHALVSVCFYGALAVLLAARFQSRATRVAVWVAAAAVAALVGLSRVYLGVHYPSDVLGGYAVAVVWLAAVQAYSHPR